MSLLKPLFLKQLDWKWRLLIQSQNDPYNEIPRRNKYMKRHSWISTQMCRVKEARQKRVCNVWFHLYKTRKCKLICSDSKSVVIWGREWEQGMLRGSDYKGAPGNFGEWWICYLYYSGFMGLWVLWVYICQNLPDVYFRYCSLCQIYLNKTVYSFLKSDSFGRNSCIQEWRAPCSLIVFLTKFLPIYNFRVS